MFDPNDGNVDPSGVTHAYAKAARDAGAEITGRRRSLPFASCRAANGNSPRRGALRAQYIVNAGGLWAREVVRLMQVELPIVPMEHQYLITNEIPSSPISARRFLTRLTSTARSICARREGLLVGTYEQDCRHWALDGTPLDFGVELLPPDMDRIVAPSARCWSACRPCAGPA